METKEMPENKELPESTDPAEVPQANSRMRPILLGVLLIALAAGGYAYWRHAARFESTDDAQIDGRVHLVSPRVGGTVVKILVDNNQFVEAGTVLVELDPKDYQVAVDRAQADLSENEASLNADRTQVPIIAASSESRLASANAGVAEARASVASGEQQVAAAEARVKTTQALVRQVEASTGRAAKDLERYQALLAKDEISRQQFDAAKAAADATAAQLDASRAQQAEAEEGVRVARSQLPQLRAKLLRAEADVKGAATAPQQVAATEAKAESTSAKMRQTRASLEQSRLNLGYTVIRAPVSGVVSERNVESGQMVAAGQPLLSVVPLGDIWVTANFKENQLAYMRPGQKVRVEVDAFGGRVYEGHVDSISAATGARFSLLPAENATGNYVKVVQRVPVKILIERGQDPRHILRPGMSVVPEVEVR